MSGPVKVGNSQEQCGHGRGAVSPWCGCADGASNPNLRAGGEGGDLCRCGDITNIPAGLQPVPYGITLGPTARVCIQRGLGWWLSHGCVATRDPGDPHVAFCPLPLGWEEMNTQSCFSQCPNYFCLGKCTLRRALTTTAIINFL